MNSNKALGLDGLNFVFIKKHWKTLRLDVYRLFMDFHYTVNILKGSNSSFVTLILKVIKS